MSVASNNLAEISGKIIFSSCFNKPGKTGPNVPLILSSCTSECLQVIQNETLSRRFLVLRK